MRSRWNNADDVWEVFIEDPRDPALGEFGFPGAAHGWLREPGAHVGELSAVEGISPKFFARFRGCLERDRVLAACFVPEADDPKEITRPSEHHFILVGGDGNDLSAGPMDVVGVPLAPRPEPPSWEAFPDAGAEFRLACEQLAGVFPNGMSAWFVPHVLPADLWRQRAGAPPAAADAERETWILQRNYYSVSTFLQAPGRIVRTDPAGRVQVLPASPAEWLARELEGGTRQQPSRADAPW